MKRMFLVLATLIAACSVSVARDKAKERDWRLGILTGINGESGSFTVNTPPVCNYVYNVGTVCSGGGQATYGTHSTLLAVSDGETTYIAERRGRTGRKATENIPIIFALDKDQKYVIFKLDDGTESKARLVKQRINTAIDQSQQCSLVTGPDSADIAHLIHSNQPLTFGWFSHCFPGMGGNGQPEKK